MSRPKSTNPKTELLTCRFPVNEAGALSRAAAKSRMSKSAFIRDAVRRVIAAEKKREDALKNGSA